MRQIPVIHARLHGPHDQSDTGGPGWPWVHTPRAEESDWYLRLAAGARLPMRAREVATDLFSDGVTLYECSATKPFIDRSRLRPPT